MILCIGTLGGRNAAFIDISVAGTWGVAGGGGGVWGPPPGRVAQGAPKKNSKKKTG
jgi:hypothetical protein